MLEIKNILKNADTECPALDDFARCVVENMPNDVVSPETLAAYVMDCAFAAKRDEGQSLDPNHAELAKYVTANGDMCKLARGIYEILSTYMAAYQDELSAATINFITTYYGTSKIYFGGHN